MLRPFGLRPLLPLANNGLLSPSLSLPLVLPPKIASVGCDSLRCPMVELIRLLSVCDWNSASCRAKLPLPVASCWLVLNWLKSKPMVLGCWTDMAASGKDWATGCLLSARNRPHVAAWAYRLSSAKAAAAKLEMPLQLQRCAALESPGA